ncbi:MAG: PilZ domain-containing protein [Candidatus Acidiferrum sp.]
MTDSPRDYGAAVQQRTSADRRVHQRLELSPRLYVVLHGSDSDGILYDVSEGGAALDIVGPKPESDTLLVEFEMSETGQRFEAPARITWRDDSAKKVGIRFLDLPDVSRTRIREWLATISPAETGPSAMVQDADREASSASQHAQQQGPLPEPLVCIPGDPQIATLQRETPRDLDPSPESQAEPTDEQPVPSTNNHLVQSLLDSFNTPQKKPNALHLDIGGHGVFSGWPLRRWIFLAVSIGAAVLLAFGVAARRSPDHNTKSSSVSKPGQRPATAAGAGQFAESDDRDGARPANPPDNSQSPPPSIQSGLSASLSAGARLPCVNLAPPADKIRIYLWPEKNTPEIIVATYRKYLGAVLDVRVVDAAPYDLVLYVNGTSVPAKTSPAGFVWSSRVFRPWYCGQSLGQLEQPEVNESLHYAQGANVDQRIRAEVAYLILHALEGLRNEHAR